MVRGIAVLTAVLAVGVIIVSLQAARAQAGQPAGQTGEPAALSEVLAHAEPASPVRATIQSSPDPAPRQPRPSIRYPAPSEALPATRAQAVSGPTNAPPRPQFRPLARRPLAAVLDLGASVPAEIAEVALLTQRSLEAQGYNVSLGQGDAAGGAGPLRPDAYVSIRAVTGDGASPGVEAWLCHVEGALGDQLADLLLKSLAASGLPNVGEGDGDITDPDAFRCDLLLAGRWRMPAVLLEVPAPAAGDGDALAQGLADGIDRFFQTYRASLLQEDQRRRLLWPAVGTLTSNFGAGHPLGIDIGQSEGRVVAATDGVVIFAGGNRCCSYGLYVVVESPEGITTVYAHLESVMVTEGRRVRQGQPLGIVGCTGNCFGTHLHFEVIEGGARQNPLSYLP